jgi:phosphatidylglycerophosphatase A
LLATGLGAGYSPFAPGTVGTLVGIPCYLVFSGLTWPLQFLSVVAFTFLAVHYAGKAEDLFAVKDSPRIVIDEIVGFQWALIFIAPTWTHIGLGFLFFRFFDIVKPFPANVFQDRLPGGWGIVADDVMAGIYGNILLRMAIAIWAL